MATAVNLVSIATSPHLLFIGLHDEGPPASSWAGPPIRALSQGISWPLGQLVEINSNIKSMEKGMISERAITVGYNGPTKRNVTPEEMLKDIK